MASARDHLDLDGARPILAPGPPDQKSSSNAYRSMSNHGRRRVTEIAHRTVEANGIPIHLAEAGTGPVVLLCHGFPESWYSWRHQLKALAEAGYRVVAPDM